MNCLDYAYHYISRYPKTRKELMIQLLKKWYTHDTSEKAIIELEKKWYVDDRQFAKLYVGSELISKGKPIIVIKNKLYEKWVDKDIIQDVMEKMQEEIYEWVSAKILKLIEEFKKKWLEGPFIISKIMSRGYSLEQIKRVLKNRDEANE